MSEDAEALTRVLAAVRDTSALTDDAWLDLLARADEVLSSPASRRASLALGAELRRLVARAPRGFWSRAIAPMVVDVWSRTEDEHVQYLCDFAIAALREDATLDDAVDWYLCGTFRQGGPDDPYVHRGGDLGDVARALPDGPRKATLLGLQSLIDGCGPSPRAGATRLLAEARRMEPSLDVVALRARCTRVSGALWPEE